MSKFLFFPQSVVWEFQEIEAKGFPRLTLVRANDDINSSDEKPLRT